MNKLLQPLSTSRKRTFPALPRIPMCTLHSFSVLTKGNHSPNFSYIWWVLPVFFFLTLYMESYSAYVLSYVWLLQLSILFVIFIWKKHLWWKISNIHKWRGSTKNPNVFSTHLKPCWFISTFFHENTHLVSCCPESIGWFSPNILLFYP